MHFVSHQYRALAAGPRLIITGAVHGNEACGTVAIERVRSDLESGRLTLMAGQLTLVPVCNPKAVAAQRREGDRNLNRNLQPCDPPVDFEDHVANWLCPLLAAHDVLLDLHSFLAPGQPFVFIGPKNNADDIEPFAHAAEEEALACRLGVSRVVDGWLTTYAQGVRRRVRELSHLPGINARADYGIGTTEYMRSQGGWALTLECGQHADAQAPERGYRAILNALLHLGMISGAAPEPAKTLEALNLYQVFDRHDEADRLVQTWRSFDAVQQGQAIAVRGDGSEVCAPSDGWILFPNPNARPGQEWFYLAQASSRFEALNEDGAVCASKVSA